MSLYFAVTIYCIFNVRTDKPFNNSYHNQVHFQEPKKALLLSDFLAFMTFIMCFRTLGVPNPPHVDTQGRLFSRVTSK